MKQAAAPFECVVLGADSLAIQCGEILLGAGHSIVALVTGTPALAWWARDHAIDVIDPGVDLVGALSGRPFDYLFSITNLSIVPDAVLALPRRGAINFHDGPLPEYAGMYTPAWALMNRESRYGISFHEMQAGIDQGHLLEQRHFEISAGETSLTLNTRCFEAGIEGFTALVARLADGSVRATPQDLASRSYFGKYDRPTAAAVLDWTRPAEELEALVRALDFGRYDNALAAAKLVHGDRVFTVRSAETLDAAGAAPGTVLAIESDAIAVAAADAALRLSGFATPFGQPLTAPALAETLQLRAGDRSSGPSAELRERLTELNGRLCRSEAFWVERLASLEPAVVPYAASAPTSAEAAPHSRTRQLAVSETPRRAANMDRPADALLAAVAGYLARIGGHERFDVAFRNPALAESLTGLESFAAPRVPLRIDAPDGVSVDAFVAGVRQELTRVGTRGTWLHDAVGRFPALAADPALGRGELLPVGIEIGEAEPKLAAGCALSFQLAPDAAQVSFTCDARVISEQDANALEAQLGRFVAAFAAADGAEPLAALPLLSDEERHTILERWNDTTRGYPLDRCVHELFSEQVERTPDATALRFEDQTCTYRELDRRANRLAWHLRELGVGPDSLVGVCIERSLEMMVGVLAVQKAGGAYVPLDPAYPRDRIAGMLEDSGAAVVLTQERLVSGLPAHRARVVRIDADWPAIATQPDTAPDSGVTPAHLAYVIYTSGSTGKPKGVMVEHRNVASFFAGMDEHIESNPPGVWLAVTSLSFDISVLELFWTLSRGFQVVLFGDAAREHGAGAAPWRPIDFGLFMWGSDDTQGRSKYDLMLESARFGDTHGFSSIWTPERHFHAFGGPYPNPALTSAALAVATERIAIRAGSCVLPLHHPIRVVEDFAVVDNLSGGRIGVSFAAGWQPNDFVIRPEGFKEAKSNMFRDIEIVHRLWRGESVEFSNPLGSQVPVATLPRPIQPELPTWVTTAGNPETFRQAGAIGANLLTHLLGQTPEEVGEKIALYRQARREAGFAPATGTVTLMLHTLVADTDAEAKALARGPMKDYLRSSVALVKNFAWAFPAFKRPGGADATPDDIDLDSLSDEELDAILEFAFERYFETSGLFGSIETCLAMVEKVKALGVDEIGCLIDYGVPTQAVLASLEALDRVRARANERPHAVARSDLDLAFRAQVERHGVTHLQCTPSMARMLVQDADAKPALAGLRQLLVGGEELPAPLAHELEEATRGVLTNMYGPTETTIWSSSARIAGMPDEIPIGRPIANTRLYVLDRQLEPTPVGVAGELMIGGDGVVRGYHDRPELTAERFIRDPFSREPNARLYRTGDRARFKPDGSVAFLGRLDEQVKIRGHRVELGEIEAQLARVPGVRHCAVAVREDVPGDQRLVAYIVSDGGPTDATRLRRHLAETLPEFMVPSAFCPLDALPLTPNGKLDRRALPAPQQAEAGPPADYVAPGSAFERQIAETWQSVLQLERVGVNDNFFDLGGHSLLVVQVHRRLKEVLDMPITLTDLYRFPTVGTLVGHLEGGGSRAAAEAGRSRADKRRALAGRRRRGRD